MNLPGRVDMQRALIADYANIVGRFGAIADYLKRWQPPALMLWGRHEPYFELAETVSWMEDLPRMEAHILDGSHFLLETHAEPALAFMLEFIERMQAHEARPQTDRGTDLQASELPWLSCIGGSPCTARSGPDMASLG